MTNDYLLSEWHFYAALGTEFRRPFGLKTASGTRELNLQWSAAFWAKFTAGRLCSARRARQGCGWSARSRAHVSHRCIIGLTCLVIKLFLCDLVHRLGLMRCKVFFEIGSAPLTQ